MARKSSGRARAAIRRLAHGAAILAASHFALVGVAHADVAGQMNSFFNDAGGAANVTGPWASSTRFSLWPSRSTTKRG